MSPARAPAPASTAEPAPHAGPFTHPTGIRWLDRELAPLPPIAHLVYAPDPGVDPGPFLLQALAAHVASGSHALHVTPREAATVRSDFGRLGFDLGRFDDDVTVVDEAGAQAALRSLGPTDLLMLDATRDATMRWPADHRGPVVAVVTPERLAGAPRPDAVVRLRRDEAQGTRVDTFQVARRAAGPPSPRAVPYRVDRPGGVRPHVAKVLITGPHNAGKSSLVHTLSGTGVSVEDLGTTVALDHGQVERDGVLVDLFGTPGQERFDPVIRQVSHGAQGVIVVVDADKPSTFHRARELAEATAGGRVPVVWAANKQDTQDAGAWSAVRERLSLAPDALLLPCVATDAVQATRVLDALLKRILVAPADPRM